MSDGSYVVQCTSGKPEHIVFAAPGSKLEARCKAREAEGFVDALCLGINECPGCVEDSQAYAHRFAGEVMLYGCPYADMDGACRDDNCPCRGRKDIPDSPYIDQIVRIPASA